MADQQQSFVKLREYAAKMKNAGYETELTDGEIAYEAKLNNTLKHLQDQVEQQEAALEKLKASNSSISLAEPSYDPVSRICHLRTVTAGYKALTEAEPTLPAPGSPLPALLALRNSINLIDQTKTAILLTKDNIIKGQELLEREENELRDARILSDALGKRVEKLRREHQEQSQKLPEALAKDILQKEHQRKIRYVKELRKLVKAFNKFVGEHLAAMLAAEDLGGPVVGDMIGIDDDTLDAGFNQQGKAKKGRVEGTTDDARRRRRIEGIWRSQSHDENADTSDLTEKDAAHANFRKLTEDLLNTAAGERDTTPYITVRRETAAVRFLVREKVAQFHPTDARKLRLVDFAREMAE